MRVLVIFGSQSDANIYEPLKARLLADGHEVDFKMISVHRSPGLLDQELQGLRMDVVVAGAGLAAHLPGVLASKLLVPVIGIPCSAALGGLDASLAIAQMPFGIPVLTTGPDAFSDAVTFLKRWDGLERSFDTDGIYIVLDRSRRQQPHMQELLERIGRIAEKTAHEFSLVDRPQANAANICLVEIDPGTADLPLPYGALGASSQEIRIYVPVFTPVAYKDPNSALLLLGRMQEFRDGLWVGANNTGNGVLAALQLYNHDGKLSAFLTNAKKGYIHR